MIRVLELYCGIGGCAAAFGQAARTVAAVDQNRLALEVYRRNFAHPTVAALFESIPEERLRRWDADLWWLSPPCQPYTRRGLRRGLDDPRAASFPVLLERLAAIRPRYLALENVPGFARSEARDRLLATLEAAGYGAVRETVLCPTGFGVPSRRRRYYLVAGRDGLLPLAEPMAEPRPLREYLDPEPDPELFVAPEVAARYDGALDVVDGDDPDAVTSCFTAAYGRSWVRSGSYLRCGDGVRRFSPREILRLLGFPDGFALPSGLRRENAWRLVGNSLPLAPVCAVLATIPGLGRGDFLPY